MKMGNLKIGTRLAIGFLLVILLTLTVGGMAFRQVRVLSNLVDEMYDHPLIVGYTMRDIRAEIDRMHDQMLRLLLIGDAAESDALESSINEAQVRVLNKFDLVMERFLGDKDNVAIAQRAFIEWKKKLDQEFTIVRSGKRDKPDSAFHLAWMNRKLCDGLPQKAYP
ncbi:MAG: MCP four helix bundle domain-containing protein [Pseudomonadota bacterium]